MRHGDFRDSINLCRERGLSDYQVASMLGCGVNSIVRWKQYDPPHYIGLAIAALENNIGSWPESKQSGRKTSGKSRKNPK